MATSLSVHVKAVIDPEKEEEFLKALEPTFKNITAEPLNIFAEVYKDPQNPGVFRFVENWNATLDHMMNVSFVCLLSRLRHFHFAMGAPYVSINLSMEVLTRCKNGA